MRVDSSAGSWDACVAFLPLPSEEATRASQLQLREARHERWRLQIAPATGVASPGSSRRQRLQLAWHLRARLRGV